MSNKAKGVVTLSAEHKLRFNTNAVAELEDHLNTGIDSIMVQFKTGQLGVKGVRAVVWAGLLHLHEDEMGNSNFTIREAGEVVDTYGFGACFEKGMEALKAFFRADEGEPQANRQQRRAPAKKGE